MFPKAVAILFFFFLKRSSTYNFRIIYTAVEHGVKKNYNSEEIAIVSHQTSSVVIKNEYIPTLHCKIFNMTSDLAFITFDTCMIEHIEEECFSRKMVNVTSKIALINNQITTIKRGTFTNLKVQYIDLKCNRIETIEDGSFVNLTLLKDLDLSFNNLRIFNSDAFVNLENFGTLNLRSNHIKSLQKESLIVFRKEKSRLNIECNELVYLDNDVFGGMTATKLRLDLQNNKLDSLPEGIFDYHSFSVVDISKNPLTNISRQFCSQNCTVETFYFGCKGMDKKSLRESLQVIEHWIEDNGIILYTDGYCSFNKSMAKTFNITLSSCKATRSTEERGFWIYFGILFVLYIVM
ncbi:hypothetical protein Zmor_022493 [Zophobas morio]|uniref:Uncharacterized protein n=1 Tax=Zophobas morio TaxID=2755281 RepID=A0AA38HW74_9CUCU|nr:hypothetical protein Zmor_022493 [Zophobas morio]